MVAQCSVCAATSVAKRSDVRLVHEKASRDRGSGFAGSNNLKLLNIKLLEIEGQIDSCINSKDKDICEKFFLGNQLLLEIYGNEEFAKLVNSSKCQVGAGTKCGATTARITAKSIQLFYLLFEFIEKDILD